MNLSRVTPVLRSFDETQTREFYVGFLGFKVICPSRLKNMP